jgi:transcription antitermination factor NusG
MDPAEKWGDFRPRLAARFAASVLKQKKLAHQAPVAEGAKLRAKFWSENFLMNLQEASTNAAPASLAEGAVDPNRHELNWYALYTCPRHEKCVAQQIEQRSISCFLPLYRSVRRWKDRRKELELALFPGYVFVRLALKDRLRVLQLPSAVRLVSFNGQPAALPEAEIDQLRERLARGSVEPHPYLRVGRRVRVCGGPMQGLEGIIVRRKDRCRVVFSLDLIMRSVAVEVDESDVEPVAQSNRRT